MHGEDPRAPQRAARRTTSPPSTASRSPPSPAPWSTSPAPSPRTRPSASSTEPITSASSTRTPSMRSWPEPRAGRRDRCEGAGNPADGRTGDHPLELEERFLAVIADARLPRPEVNVEGRPIRSRLPLARRVPHRRDRRRATHLTPAAFEEDRRRDAVHSMMGFRTLRFTWQPGRLRATFRPRRRSRQPSAGSLTAHGRRGHAPHQRRGPQPHRRHPHDAARPPARARRADRARRRAATTASAARARSSSTAAGRTACLALAVAHDGAELTTVEGLATSEAELHPLQAAFIEHDAFQCGYCTPGQLCSAVGMIAEAEREGVDARRPRDPRAHERQPLPLRRVPEHRRRDRGHRRVKAFAYERAERRGRRGRGRRRTARPTSAAAPTSST